MVFYTPSHMFCLDENFDLGNLLVDINVSFLIELPILTQISAFSKNLNKFDKSREQFSRLQAVLSEYFGT